MHSIFRTEFDPDEQLEEEIQREIDDRRELSDACEPWFSNAVFVEMAALIDQYLDGQRAGRIGTRSSCNPNHVGTAEYDAWERGRSCTEARRLCAA